MISAINTIIGKAGLRGALVSIDVLPPFMLRFDFPADGWKQTKSANWDYVGNPGGRFKYPMFADMGEDLISFKVLFDSVNRNNVLSPESVSGAIGRQVYKGVPDAVQVALNASRMDHISIVKSLCDKFKSPKKAVAKIAQVASGKILNISQAQSEPTPPLTLLVKNPSESYIGYVIKADVSEENFDSLGYCNRVIVDFEYAVIPDLILSSYKDILAEIHAVASLI